MTQRLKVNIHHFIGDNNSMNVFRTTIFFILLLGLLAACTTISAEVPAEIPAAPTTVSEPVAETGSLTANPWQWVSFTSPVAHFRFDEPLNYLLTFNEDGTVNIVADCNTAMGTYTTEASKLTIVVGPMTRAACPR